MNHPLTAWVCRAGAAVVLLIGCLGGCVQLPTQVEAELSAPDGERPNNFALRESAGEALATRSRAGAP